MNKILKGLAVIVCVLAIFAIFGTVGFAQVNPAEIEIDRIVFSGSSGELTAVPASDTSIQASVTVTNKLTTKKTVLFWAASYTGDALKGVAVDSVELDPGENPVSLSFNIGDGVDKLQAGIWGSAELMAPYINAAVFPSEKSGIEAVYVDGVKYDDFDENTKTYTYFLPVDATKPAYVYATSKNSNKAIEVVQAAKLGESATIKEGTNEYSIKFIAWDTEVGTASDFMKGGILSTEVYAAPSLGIAPPNLTVDANGNALTSDQMFAELQSVPTKYPELDTNAYRAFSNFNVVGNWTKKINNIYGYNIKFIHAPAPDSILYGENVTRIVKPANDGVSAAVAEKMYEFDINKGATVYISITDDGYSRARKNVKSTYIESLNKGWKHDYDAVKYGMYVWDLKEYKNSNNETFYITTGTKSNSWANSGSVYYKHFNAGDHVEIPAYSETAGNYNISIYIVWDNFNTEAKLFDILVDGEPIGYDENTLTYEIDLAVADEEIPEVSVAATLSANAVVEQAASLDGTAKVTACGKTYTIKFNSLDKTLGTLSNVKMKGVATTQVYGVPNLGINPPNLTVDENGNARTGDQKIAAARALVGTEYDDKKYVISTDRFMNGSWGSNPYNQKFIMAEAPGKFLYGKYVTRLMKPSNDAPTAATASKTYEFDINKGATVYLTVSKSKSRTIERVTSPYIESLNKDWTFDYDNKYLLNTWGDGVTATGSDGTSILVPNGNTTNSWLNSGSVYYKHFNAGDHVEIPAYSETASDMQVGVYIKWDHLNEESKIFGINVDGVALSDFNTAKALYTVTVEEGSDVPEITAVATKGANAIIKQAETLDDVATVTVGEIVYAISFEKVAPNMELSDLMVDGLTISGFDPEIEEYTYTVERGITQIPDITATASLSTRTVTVKQAEKMPGKALVTVLAPSGAKKEYTVNFVKTGTPGVASNFTYGGVAVTSNSPATQTVKAIPSLGAENIDVYNMFETDAERVAYMKSADNAYENLYYSMYSDRDSANAWDAYSGYINWAEDISYTYGIQMEFILVNHKNSVLISPDVTRLLKPANDPSGTKSAPDEEKAKNAYTFDISKDATVYITPKSKSPFIESLGWDYVYDAKKYTNYRPTRTAAIRAIDVTQTKNDNNGNTIHPAYFVPDGNVSASEAGSGHAYYKHFTADEKVVVPAFAANGSSRMMSIFIVWDDCNDERNLYGVKYQIGDGAKTKVNFDLATTTYDIIVPQGTTVVPTLNVSATRPANVQVDAPAEFTNGKAVVTMTAELEAGVKSTYTFNFYVDSPAEDDVRIADVTFNGNDYAAFEMYTRDYAIELAYGVEYPVIAAVANSNVANVAITQPIDNSGVGLVNVTSQNGNYQAVYTFTFTKLDYVLAEATVMNVKDGKKSIVTIVHDDGDVKTTVPYLDREMQKNGLKTTVGMITTRIADVDENLNTTEIAKWMPYFEAGRLNLASHSYTHSYMGTSDSVAEPEQEGAWGSPVPATYVGKMSKEVKKSQEILKQAFPGQRVLTYIKPGVNYPVGKAQVSEEGYEMIRETYIAMRNTGGGIDTIPPADWYNIKSLSVVASDDPTSGDNQTAAYWVDEVDKTISKNGWLTFLFHGIEPGTGSSGSSVLQSKTSILFDKLGDRVERDDVWNPFFDEAVLYVKEAFSANVVAKDYTHERGYISIEVTDAMDDDIYNYPITIKTAVPETWEYVKNIQGTTTEIQKSFVEDGVTYVYANVVPDRELAYLSAAESDDYLTSISVGGTEIEDFEPTIYLYNVTLPAGTQTAPVVSANGAIVTQATLVNGEGAAEVVFNAAGTEVVYTIYFETEKVGPVVMLKFDDLRENEAVRTAFKNAVAYCDEVGIKANVGVIAVSMEDSATVDKTTYYNEIKKYIADGHEVWNHGYYHNTDQAIAYGYTGEFATGTYEDQLDQLNRSTALFKEKVGYEPVSFGSPGNGSNENTARAFNDFNASGTHALLTNVYFYDNPALTDVRGYTIAANFEGDYTDDSTWNPTLIYRKFIADYESKKSNDYLILQTHPLVWGANAQATYYKVFRDQIDYLLMNGARFMTGSQYDAYLDALETNN